MSKRTQTQYQYEPLITPESWDGEERRFAIRLGMILDTLHQRLGQLFASDRMYPVGSVYLSVQSTDPHKLFGGTWQAVSGSWPTGVRAWKRTA